MAFALSCRSTRRISSDAPRSAIRSGRCGILRSCMVIAVFSSLLLVAPGCKTNDHGQVGSLVVFSDDGQYLDPPIGTGVVLDAQQAVIPDCPPPVGFVPIADACAVSVTPGGARSVYHLYQGRSAPREVQAAYRRNLPHYDWELAGTVDDPDTGYPALIFHKGIEELYVRVRQDRSKTTLVIEIAPR